MRLIFSIFIFCFFFFPGNGQSVHTVLFDDHWKFQKGSLAGAEHPDYKDDQWRLLDLTHDWSIEDLPNQKKDSIIGPFSRYAPGGKGTAYTIGGTAWYRKQFILPDSSAGRNIFLQFDGIYMNSDVWINGHHLGNHPYGYTSFYYELTPFLNPPGQTNVVAVEVKNEGRNARWYSGSGIYRHVWLIESGQLYIPIWETSVKTPKVTELEAEVLISTRVRNTLSQSKNVFLKANILDPSGKIINTSILNEEINKEESHECRFSFLVNRPNCWTPENPAIYRAKIQVIVDKKIIDEYVVPFGIREMKFDPINGFTLNGKSMKLKGACIHHDNGPLGARAIDRAEERRIELLKKAGFNAIRCAHNPPSPFLLDVCDRLGMLVIDEFSDMWEKPKVNLAFEILGAKDNWGYNVDDYSKYFKTHWKKDLEGMIKRDRNHPSVIMWSIGNEIPEAADSSGLRIARNLVSFVHTIDSTRPVTEAITFFGPEEKEKVPFKKQESHMTLLDVVGYNYNFNDYSRNHEKHPEWVMYGSESMTPFLWENWQKVESSPYVIGDFTWTGMDYLGEAGAGIPRFMDKQYKNESLISIMSLFYGSKSWPAINSFQGVLDLIGTKKTAAYYQDVIWKKSKLEMFVQRPVPPKKIEITSPWGFPDEIKSWSWPVKKGEIMKVQVFTLSSSVRLELNGKVVGQKNMDKSQSITATFDVPYEEGTLSAYCYDNWRETGSETLKTLGKPVAIRLVADRSTIKANKNDLAFVTAEIIDSEGNILVNSDLQEIQFQVSGNGKLEGVGNGNPFDMSSFQQPLKKVYQGRCLLIVSPNGVPGEITIKATAEGLKDGMLTLKVEL